MASCHPVASLQPQSPKNSTSSVCQITSCSLRLHGDGSSMMAIANHGWRLCCVGHVFGQCRGASSQMPTSLRTRRTWRRCRETSRTPRKRLQLFERVAARQILRTRMYTMGFPQEVLQYGVPASWNGIENVNKMKLEVSAPTCEEAQSWRGCPCKSARGSVGGHLIGTPRCQKP